MLNIQLDRFLNRGRKVRACAVAVQCNPFRIKGYADVTFDGWDLMDLRPYRRQMSNFWEAAIVVRTGYPFKCVFCDTSRTFGKQWVLRDPRQVAAEVVEVQKRHGVRSVFLADDENRRRVGQEMADVLILLVSMADVLGINLIEAARAKLDENARKYPVERARGNARKDDALPSQ